MELTILLASLNQLFARRLLCTNWVRSYKVDPDKLNIMTPVRLMTQICERGVSVMRDESQGEESEPRRS